MVWQGENPFAGNQEDHDPEDSIMELSEADLTTESLNEVKTEEAGLPEEEAGHPEEEAGHPEEEAGYVEGEAETAEEEGQPATEAVGNGDGHEEDVKMDMGEAGDEEEEVEGVEVGEEEAAGLNDNEATGDSASTAVTAE